MNATKKLNTQRFDSAKYLDNESTIASFLQSILEEGDVSLLASALGVIAKAKGMTSIAEETGLTRESLYKALRADAQPRLDTILRVLGAVGVEVTLSAAKKNTKKATRTRSSDHALA